MKIAIIGGGPAGLRAAEVASKAGAEVTLFEAKPSVGRKFLVAGKGGLNLTKDEPWETFATRYAGRGLPASLFPSLIREFDANHLRQWAAELGVDTFAASTGRVYPREMKAAPLLRRWVERLRQQGVALRMRHRWCGLQHDRSAPLPFLLRFETEEGEIVEEAFQAVILALGGGSWPDTGSNGEWVKTLKTLGVEVSPLAPANCGWEVSWPSDFLQETEGQPLKNIALNFEGSTAKGELLITRYGVEGGALYQLGAALREAKGEVVASLDIKPDTSSERLLARLGPVGTRSRDWLAEGTTRWRLSPVATALLKLRAPYSSAEALIADVKGYPLHLLRPRPIAEAISSAGGVQWKALTPALMLQHYPGLFVAGEMIDWEAPTGGYLIQGCFATGTHAAREAVNWCKG